MNSDIRKLSIFLYIIECNKFVDKEIKNIDEIIYCGDIEKFRYSYIRAFFSQLRNESSSIEY
jgi:hypothetical protein